MSARLGPLDLLQERRRASGALEPGGPMVPARGLLVRGAAVGAGVFALMLLLLAVVSWRQQQVGAALAQLSGVKAQVQALETRVGRVRQVRAQLQRSADGLAQGLVAVSSGSALLTQLSRVTPAGIQLTELREQGNQLVLKGTAVDRQAFRRVNSLILLLQDSPLFEGPSIQVKKLDRDGADQQPLNWELIAQFSELTPSLQLETLRSLAADGLAKRLLLLRSYKLL